MYKIKKEIQLGKVVLYLVWNKQTKRKDYSFTLLAKIEILKGLLVKYKKYGTLSIYFIVSFQYQHTGRLARYHNIMGLETIQVLDKLTSEIRFVFLHPTMIDRIAAMLNYFLKNLVGPERKSFKVCCIYVTSFVFYVTWELTSKIDWKNIPSL